MCVSVSVKKGQSFGMTEMADTRDDIDVSQAQHTSDSEERCNSKIFSHNTGKRIEQACADLIVALDFKFFEKLSLTQLMETVSIMGVAKFSPGEYIFKKGSVGHHFYSLFSGEVDIILQEGAKPVATLGPGQSFGELALLNDAPRAASVRCKTQAILGVISRHEFTSIVSTRRAIAEAMVWMQICFLLILRLRLHINI